MTKKFYFFLIIVTTAAGIDFTNIVVIIEVSACKRELYFLYLDTAEASIKGDKLHEKI